MSKSAKTEVRSYIAAVPPKARAALKKIRAAVRAVAPRAEEAFSYRIPAFSARGAAARLVRGVQEPLQSLSDDWGDQAQAGRCPERLRGVQGDRAAAVRETNPGGARQETGQSANHGNASLKPERYIMGFPPIKKEPGPVKLPEPPKPRPPEPWEPARIPRDPEPPKPPGQ